MADKSENNSRIAKNTLMLYFRMFLIMALTLYTSRVVLKTLGIEDYGIYNVVGGVVFMFSFLNTALAASTQRYLNYELGREDFDGLQKVFVTAIYIHALISLIIIVLAETVGLWFLYNKMTIPDARMGAAFWVFQFSILSIVVVVMSAPYNAVIVAHEKMSAFAYISVLEVILKLSIVFLLQIGIMDKLIFYAFLMFAVQMSIRLVYGTYCKRHFNEARFRPTWNKKLFREMLEFSGWNLFGNFSQVASTHGVNIIFNMFFSPAVNAARGVAVMVQNAVYQFSSNFQVAINPQITKSYAVQDFGYMHNLVCKSSRFTFIMLYMLSLPIILETDMILNVWLADVPEYTSPFIRLLLMTAIINAMSGPLKTSALANGNMKVYQLVVGTLMLSILPISYVVLKMGYGPVSVFVVTLCVYVADYVAMMFLVRPMIHLSILNFFKNVILRCSIVCVLSTILPIILKLLLKDGVLQFFVVCIVSVFSVAFFSYFIGLSVSERSFITQKAKQILLKFQRK